jgi:hypothetical protein
MTALGKVSAECIGSAIDDSFERLAVTRGYGLGEALKISGAVAPEDVRHLGHGQFPVRNYRSAIR